MGSGEEYVQLVTTGEGQGPAGRPGLELRLEGSTRRRAPYYTGQVPVLTAVGRANAAATCPRPARPAATLKVFIPAAASPQNQINE